MIRASIDEFFENDRSSRFSPTKQKDSSENPFGQPVAANQLDLAKVESRNSNFSKMNKAFKNYAKSETSISDSEPDSLLLAGYRNTSNESRSKLQFDSKGPVPLRTSGQLRNSKGKKPSKKLENGNSTFSEKYPPKEILSLWRVPIYFEKYINVGALINLESLFYSLFYLPIKFLFGSLKICFCCRRRNRRLRAEMYLFFTLITSVVILVQMTDVSSMYHWIKGKAFIKLVTFYSILEMADILGRSVGNDLIYSLVRDVYKRQTSFKVMLLLIIYTIGHTYLLLFQLLALNTVFQSSLDTFFLFILSNNVTEIKIYVFKSAPLRKMYDIACRDIVERNQQFIYLIYMMISNKMDPYLIRAVFVFLFTEMGVDWLKNFFLSLFCGHDPSVFLSFRYLTFKYYLSCKDKCQMREGPDEAKLEPKEQEEDIVKILETNSMKKNYSKANKKFIVKCNEAANILFKSVGNDLQLYRNNLTQEYCASLMQCFTILPQACLVLRCFWNEVVERQIIWDELCMLIAVLIPVGITLTWFMGKVNTYFAMRVMTNKIYS